MKGGGSFHFQVSDLLPRRLLFIPEMTKESNTTGPPKHRALEFTDLKLNNTIHFQQLFSQQHPEAFTILCGMGTT